MSGGQQPVTYFYHSIIDSPYMPRDLEADGTQSAILTLLAEFWVGTAAEVPSAAIVDLMGAIGVTETAARAALSRLSRKGSLDVSKNGRRTSYRLSDQVVRSIPASQALTLNFGVRDQSWDGNWTVVVFSIPEMYRDRRQLLREWLRWLGFGPVRDGVWIAPHARVEFTHESLAGVLPNDGLVFRSSQIVGDIDPDEVWSLGPVRAHYDTFIDDFRPFVYRIRASSLSPSESLRTAVNLVGRWRAFPTIDPDLPAAAMPVNWRRGEARRVFTTVYDGAVPQAADLVRSVVRRYSSDAAESVRTLSVDEAIREYALRAPEEEPTQDLASLVPSKLRQAVA